MGRNYRDLIAWQKGMDLVELVYRTSRSFPREETYGLTSQVRRAAVSVPANIAEGQGRGGDKEFVRFLCIAHGSLPEVETLTLIAERLQFVDPSVANTILENAAEVGRILTGLINAKRGSGDRGPD